MEKWLGYRYTVSQPKSKTDSQQTANRQPTDSQQTANRQPTDSQQTANRQPTDSQILCCQGFSYVILDKKINVDENLKLGLSKV